MLFTELPLCDSLLEGLQAMNFRETTPVQEQAIPVILDKKDVIACAQTGTGKTAAFLLPLLDNLQTDGHDKNKINAIIMAPTRELAQQIDQQMEGFSYFTPFSSVAVYGGNDGDAWEVQKKGLLSGADVVIATPGRLLSHINLYDIDFSGVKYFILDEADRMLDMGFYDDIMKIEKLLPKERQTVMFSATMPTKIQQLAKSILHNPLNITIAISKPPETIMQSAYICHEAQKINIVKHLFKEKVPNKVILFSGSKQKVKEIAKILKHMGLSAGEMHSDLDQTQRNHVMHEFKNERVNILVATDIVARGIDIDDISLIINFDVPYDAEDYVHRIGRTARAGDSGMAITFVSPDEQYRFSRIEEFLGKEIYRIPVPKELGDAPEYNPVRDSRRRNVPTRSTKGRGKGAGKKGGKSSERRGTDKEDREKRMPKAESAEAAGRREGSGTGVREGSERRERSERREGSNRSDNTVRAQNRENRGGKSGKQGEPRRNRGARSEEAVQLSETTRSERADKVERNDRQGRSVRSGREDKTGKNERREGSGRNEGKSQERETSRRQGAPKRQTSQREQSNPQNQDGSGEQRPVRKTRNNRTDRTDRSDRTEGTTRQQGRRREGSSRASSPANAGNSRKKSGERSFSSSNKATTPQKNKPAQEQATKTGKSRKWSWWPFGKK